MLVLLEKREHLEIHQYITWEYIFHKEWRYNKNTDAYLLFVLLVCFPLLFDKSSAETLYLCI